MPTAAAVSAGVYARGLLGSVANGRFPVRPVLKHGPRSLTRAQVTGRYETQRRNEGEGLLLGGLRWDPVVFGRYMAGAPPARLVGVVREAEQERTCWDPKDGELCLSRSKPEETLVEDRSDSDVQIDRWSWV